MERRGAFDYILLETTGVADPGNIAPIFWLDEGLGSSIYLDGIVTVVDAKNVLKSLDEPAPDELPPGADGELLHHEGHQGPLLTTAHLQISHADIILLNKIDLVSPSQLQTVTDRLTSINALAKLIPTTHSRIPPGQLSGTILDLDAYSTFPASDAPPASFTAKGHSHLDPTISTLSLPIPPFDPQKLYFLEGWIQSILWEHLEKAGRYEIHRMKGWIQMTDGTARVVQGVREIFEIIEVDWDKMTPADRKREGRIVLIGRHLDQVPGILADSTG